MLLSVAAFIFNYTVLKGFVSGSMLIAVILFAKALAQRGEKLFAFTSKHIFTVYIYSWIFQSFALILLTKLNVNLLSNSMIVEFTQSHGKKSANDYKRLIKKIEDFCNRSLAKDETNDESSTVETTQN